MARILIKVTQEDIKNGFKKNCESCPVAKAVLRTLGSNRISVRVWDSIIVLNVIKGKRIPAELISVSRSVKRFVNVFDKTKKKAKPFNFFLQVPDGMLEKIK